MKKGLHTGTLVRFVPGRYGFLAPDNDGENVFIHHSKLPEGCVEGCSLQFRIGEGNRGLFAYDCKAASKVKGDSQAAFGLVDKPKRKRLVSK